MNKQNMLQNVKSELEIILSLIQDAMDSKLNEIRWEGFISDEDQLTLTEMGFTIKNAGLSRDEQKPLMDIIF